MLTSRWGLAVLALAACVAALAQDGERVLSFESDILIHEDRSMTVTERIRVRSTGDEIKRGIYRDFPTRYEDHNGISYVVKFEVVQVARDGLYEPYHIEENTTYDRVYMGNKDVFIPHGVHEYVLTYRTDRQLGFFEDHDELYWNVTGNEWSFPIDEARAVVRLPKPVPPQQLHVEGYTGLKGAKEQNYYATAAEPGTAYFETTGPLAPGEGLTIVVTFPKGTIPAPTPAELRAYWWRDNRISVFAFLSVIALIAYYIFAWLLVGRDPRKGRILPAEHPPGDLSPAALRYISRMGSDNLTFTVALLNMAAKGYIRIEEEGNYVISRGKAKQAVLTEEESAIAHELLPEGTDRFAFKQKYASKITKTLRDFKRTLKRNHQKPYFSRNGAYLMPGIVLSFIVVGAALFDLPGDGTLMALFLSIWLTGWTFGCVALVKGAVNAWRNIKKDEVLSYGALIGSILFSIPFLIAEVAVLGILIWNFGVTLSALILSVAVINVIFFRLMKAYTPEGRRVMDALEAFKMTLRGEGRAVLAGSGDESKQVYERYLPYAAAVGAINDWSEQLNKALVQAGQPRGNYHPRWYSVSGNDHVDVGSFTNGLSSSIANSVVSSSSSSSGGGGGGSSGGGGGGGGGGGW